MTDKLSDFINDELTELLNGFGALPLRMSELAIKESMTRIALETMRLTGFVYTIDANKVTHMKSLVDGVEVNFDEKLDVCDICTNGIHCCCSLRSKP